MIRVVLPMHLCTLAHINNKVVLDVRGKPTQCSILDELELRYPMLKGTIRDHVTKKRRSLVRFFACGEDISLEPSDAPLPEAVVKGQEPFLIIGSVAGG